MRILNERGIEVIIISNQAGVGKKFFTLADLRAVNDRMLKEIRATGGRIKDVYYCVHRAEDGCACRKPGTGLFEKAAKKYGLDISEMSFIGDAYTDILAGSKLGMETIFVLSGKGSRKDMTGWMEKPDHVFADLSAAVKWLTERKRGRGGLTG